MQVSFLPVKVKKKLEEIAGTAEPVSATRAGADVRGGPGESYVVAYNDRIVVLSRALGQNDYSVLSGGLMDDVKRFSLERESHSTIVLSFEIGGESGLLKFSSVEEDDLAAIAGKWREVSSLCAMEGEEVGNPASSLPPMMAMAAALMYVSAVDGEVAKEENRYIANLRGMGKEGLYEALEYFRAHSFDELLQSSLSNLSEEQNLCVLANMLEVGMSDGILHKSEIELAKKFAEHAGIGKEEYNAVKQVLLVKNKISVLLT